MLMRTFMQLLESNPVTTLPAMLQHVETVRDATIYGGLIAHNDATVPSDGSPVMSLDENYPKITFASPASGAIRRGSPSVNGYVSDIDGIAQTASIPADGVLLVDGAYYDSFTDPYRPNHFVNTTVFPNGPRTLTMQVTNNLGTTTQASVAVTFSS
ncbi:MAG: hypothetical protein M0Z99_34525 [Betaproteobacteria bacterium]|nr:hypothetical protein [Betaproteobacteria bacterium]